MDVEAIAWVRTMLAKYRGLIKSSTYQGMSDRLNAVQGEMQSLKTQLGHALAELESTRGERDALKTECDMLRSSLEHQSTAKTDSQIESSKGAETLSEAIVAIESGAIESGEVTTE